MFFYDLDVCFVFFGEVCSKIDVGFLSPLGLWCLRLKIRGFISVLRPEVLYPPSMPILADEDTRPPR